MEGGINLRVKEDARTSVGPILSAPHPHEISACMGCYISEVNSNTTPGTEEGHEESWITCQSKPTSLTPSTVNDGR